MAADERKVVTTEWNDWNKDWFILWVLYVSINSGDFTGVLTILF